MFTQILVMLDINIANFLVLLLSFFLRNGVFGVNVLFNN